MKNNEMVSGGNVSLIKLPEKFTEDHPVAATIIYVAPIAVPAIWNGVKYIVDKIAATKIECCRIKAMAENGIVVASIVGDSETTLTDDSIAV